MPSSACRSSGLFAADLQASLLELSGLIENYDCAFIGDNNKHNPGNKQKCLHIHTSNNFSTPLWKERDKFLHEMILIGLVAGDIIDV